METLGEERALSSVIRMLRTCQSALIPENSVLTPQVFNANSTSQKHPEHRTCLTLDILKFWETL